MAALALTSFHAASFLYNGQLCRSWCLASHKPPFMNLLSAGDKTRPSYFFLTETAFALRRCVHHIFPFTVLALLFPAGVECSALSLKDPHIFTSLFHSSEYDLESEHLKGRSKP